MPSVGKTLQAMLLIAMPQPLTIRLYQFRTGLAALLLTIRAMGVDCGENRYIRLEVMKRVAEISFEKCAVPLLNYDGI